MQFKASQQLAGTKRPSLSQQIENNIAEAEQPKNVGVEDRHSDQEEEFQADCEKVQKAIDFIMLQKQIGVWQIEKIIGAGANGVVAKCRHKGTQEICVMKVAISSASFHSLIWESEVMGRIMRAPGEDRTQHLVRRKGAGLCLGPEGEGLPYVVMENLPGNPVSIIGCCVGDELISKVCEYGLQLLKAVYDLHKCGFLHRDIKPENLGLYKKEILILYDLGMSRSFTEHHGNLREPRSNIGMRGTDEWASLSAELGKDQGPVDDLWGWFYVMIEWMNCTSKSPLAWAAFDDRPEIRHLMKSNNFPSRLVLRGCPKEFFKIQAYLRSLGRCDSPNYFYLATLLKNAKSKAENNNDSPVAANGDGTLKANGPKIENRENAMEKIVTRMNREEVYFARV
uniref:Protein kinase domain-containing protein n=1 Tax=Panagrolaimus davidi TaxID=227884 RepID=A0A914QAX7_9BILA